MAACTSHPDEVDAEDCRGRALRDPPAPQLPAVEEDVQLPDEQHQPDQQLALGASQRTDAITPFFFIHIMEQSSRTPTWSQVQRWCRTSCTSLAL